MDKPIIKTYSRKQPVSAFKSSATLVPVYPDTADIANIRESRLQDKTLEVNVFEDTFDRLATGVIIRSPKHSPNEKTNGNKDSNNEYETASDDDSKKEIVRSLRDDSEEVFNDSAFETTNSKESNKNVAENKRTGVKRKVCDYESNDENLEESTNSRENELSAEDIKFQEPMKKNRKTVNNEKQKLFNEKKEMQLNKCTVLLEKYNMDDKLHKNELINVINSKMNKSPNHNKEHSEFLKPKPLKGIEQFLLTSTPREQKLRMNVNIDNLSPIILNKNNNENDHESIDSLIIENEEQELKKNIFQSNLNNHNDMSPQKDDLKSSVLSAKNDTSANEFCNPLENDVSAMNGNDIDNNLNESKLLPINGLHNNNENNIHEYNNSQERISVIQPIVEKQSLNVTPSTEDTNMSYVESPLLFHDTPFKKNQIHKNESITLDTTSNNTQTCSSNENKVSSESKEKPNEEFDYQMKLTYDDESSNSTKSDSFSLHEWTNDYNSSYEYLTEVERLKQKEISDFDNDEHLKQILSESTAFKNLNAEKENDLSVFPTKDFLEEINIKSKIIEAENMEVNDIFNMSDVETVVLNKNQVVAKITYDKDEVTDDCSKHDQSVTLNEDIEDHRTSPTSNIENLEKPEDHAIELSQEQSSEEQIKMNIDENNELNSIEENIFDTENEQDNINESGQSTPSNNSPTSNDDYLENSEIEHVENVSAMPIEDINKSTFGQSEEMQLENEETSDEQTKKSIVDSEIEAMDEKEGSTTSDLTVEITKNNEIVEITKNDQTIEITKSNQNIEITKNDISTIINIDNKYQRNKDIDPKLNYQKLVVRIARLDHNLYKKSPILSRRDAKRAIKSKSKNVSVNKIVKKKNIKSIEKVDSSTIKENSKISTSNEASKEKNQFNEMFNNMELRVLITKLEDINDRKISSVSAKKNSKSKTVALKKTKIIETNIDNIGNAKSGTSRNKSVRINLAKNMETSFDNEREIFHLKLNDAVNTMTRRKTFKTTGRQLTAITENQVQDPFDEIEEDNKRATRLLNLRKQSVNVHKDIHNISIDENNLNNSFDDANKNQFIFLKPGKSWARSLSIINHFHNMQNLDELAVGRGQNWRHSVQTILNMQPEGIVQSGLRAQDEDRESNLQSFPISEAIREERNRFPSVLTSPRFSRRFSVRIVPSGRISTLTDDFSDSERFSYISNRTRKTSLARKISLLAERESLIETEDDLIKLSKNIILKRCKQTSYTPFNVCFPDSYINKCRKIGEGVYGEVFMYENKNEKSVIKIIPIEGEELVNCEPQKKFHEILSEIIIAQELHKLKFGKKNNTNGFVGVNRIMCVIGSYPKKLIELWRKYDLEKKSENDCPSMFGNQQLYIILELAHGGQDLESFVFQNASECHSIFIQTAFSLAVAEKSLEFEHRDLHWGNVLISKTDEDESAFKLDNVEVLLPTKGVKVAVIDFTLSRMSYQGCKIFNDLATDPTLFTAQGEYQFDIYRMMRDNVKNDWQQFQPYTNILWLDYILDKMINAVRYKKKTTKIHKTMIQQLKDLRKEILTYDSAFDFVKNCESIAAFS